jgi:hypothetical protein
MPYAIVFALNPSGMFVRGSVSGNRYWFWCAVAVRGVAHPFEQAVAVGVHLLEELVQATHQAQLLGRETSTRLPPQPVPYTSFSMIQNEYYGKAVGCTAFIRRPTRRSSWGANPPPACHHNPCHTPVSQQTNNTRITVNDSK